MDDLLLTYCQAWLDSTRIYLEAHANYANYIIHLYVVVGQWLTGECTLSLVPSCGRSNARTPKQ